MSRLKQLLQKYWPAATLFLISTLIFLLNYSPKLWLLGWDNLVPEFNYTLNIKRAIFSAWQEYQGLGLAGGMGHGASLTRELFLWLVSPIIPTKFIRYFWILLMLIIGPIGVWLTSNLLIRQKSKNQNSQLASFVAGNFYLFNLATIQYFYAPFETFSSFFGFFPWLILTSLRYLKSGKKKDALLLLATSVASTSAFQVQTLFVVYGLIMSLFLLETFIKKGWQYKKRVVGWINITLIANLFWLIPVAYFTIFHSSVNVLSKQNQIATPELLIMNKNFGDPKEILSLQGYWFNYLDKNEKDEIVYMMEPWRDHLSNEDFLWIARILSISGFLGLLIFALEYRKKTFAKSFLLFPVGIFLILTSGKEPFGKIYNIILEYVPLFQQIFRTTFTKWSMVFAFFIALGIGFLFYKIQQLFGKYLAPLYAALIIGLSIAVVIPMFQGELFYKHMKVDLPDQYQELFDFFENEPKQSRISLLPSENMWSWDFADWKYRGSGFLWYGIEQPILSRTFDVFSAQNETFYHQFSEAFRNENVNEIKNILNIYDVDYLILDNSLIEESKINNNSNNYRQILSAIDFEKVFDENGLVVWERKNHDDSFVESPKYLDIIETPDLFQTRLMVSDSDFISDSSVTDSKQLPFADISKQTINQMIRGEKTLSFKQTINSTESKNYKISFPEFEVGERLSVITKLTFDKNNIYIEFPSPLSFEVNDKSYSLANLGNYKIALGETITINNQSFSIEKNSPSQIISFNAIVGEEIAISTLESKTINNSIWNKWLTKQEFNIFLSEGEQTIKIQTPYSNHSLLPQLIAIPEPANCDIYKRGEVDSITSNNKENSEEIITYQAKDFAALCLSLELVDLSPEQSYILSYTGNSIAGRPPRFLVNSSFDNYTYVQNLTSEGSFNENYALLPQTSKNDHYFFNIEVKSFGEDISIAEISQMDLLKLSAPIEKIAKIKVEPVGYSELNNVISVDENHVTKWGTSFYKIDNIHKVSDAQKSGIISLSQGYDKGWVAVSSKNLFKTLPHLVFNGWANAWEIPTDEQTIYLIYLPQIFVLIALGMLVVSLPVFSVLAITEKA